MIAHQPLLLGAASELSLAILAATDSPLTLEGAYSQLQALVLFSYRAQRAAVKDIINASPYACAQLDPCRHLLVVPQLQS